MNSGDTLGPIMPPTEPDRISPTTEVPITSWSFQADAVAPVVIGIHDFTANGLWFGDLAVAGDAHVRVVAPDLRGRAASVTAPPPAALDDHVADLLGLADQLDAATFSIVGHGTGGMLALAVAAAAPARVTQVVLLDGPPVLEDGPGSDWITEAARVDPGITRLRRTWAHRDAAVADGVTSGRLPASGMSRSLRRAVDAEITGSGFGWQARLAATTLEHDWALLRAWTPPSRLDTTPVSFTATHGHRVDDPPIERRNPGDGACPLQTTHTGLLVDPRATRTIAECIVGSAPDSQRGGVPG
jgi:pimeloyl-ACP methyl ester carboxylesterase